MNITLPTLDVEQQAAFAQLAQKHASKEAWVATLIVDLINEQVLRNINDKGAQLLEAAKQLPKAKRLDFTAQAETLLTTIATS